MDKEELKKIRQMLNGSLSKLDDLYSATPDKEENVRLNLKNIIGETVVYLDFVNNCFDESVDLGSEKIVSLLAIVKDHCKLIMSKNIG